MANSQAPPRVSHSTMAGPVTVWVVDEAWAGETWAGAEQSTPVNPAPHSHTPAAIETVDMAYGKMVIF